MGIIRTRLGLAVHQTTSIEPPSNAAAMAALAAQTVPSEQLKVLKVRAQKLGELEGMPELIQRVEDQVERAQEQGGFSHRAATWALLALLRTIELAETERHIAAVVRDAKAQHGRSKGAAASNKSRAKLPAAGQLKAEYERMLAAGTAKDVAKHRLRKLYEVTHQALNSKLRLANKL